MRIVLIATATVLLAAACGTRLPDSAFRQQTTGGNGNASAVGSGDNGGDNSAGGSSDAIGATTGSGGANGAGSGNGAGSDGGQVGASGAGGGRSAGASGPNVASDAGVTPTTITIGNVTGLNGFLGPEAFGPTLHGLQAFVAYTNAHGGVHGRKLILKTCDDQQDATQNLVCTQKLDQSDHVFAFLANNSLSPQPSAKYEFQHGIPDLGLPLDNGYAKYPNMFSLYGDQSPRDGTQTGDHGTNWQDTAAEQYYHQVLGASKVGFLFYSQAASQQQAKLQERKLQAAGFQIVYEPNGGAGENIGGAQWDTDVQTMKSKGVDIVFDTVDVSANQKICAAMDRYGVTAQIKAKVTTIEGWNQGVADPSWSQGCRNKIYSQLRSVPYSDSANPAIKTFTDAFNAYEKPQGAILGQWSVDGWTSGQILVDYLNVAGGAPTRKGFIQYLDSFPYNGYNGAAAQLITPTATWWQSGHHPQSISECYAFAQWQDSAGTFVVRSGTPASPYYCATTTEIGFPYTDDGS